MQCTECHIRENAIFSVCIVIISLAMLFGMSRCIGVSGGKAQGRRAVTSLMDSAEVIMNDAPEHALALIDSIAPESIHNCSLNARYALLYSESLFKNYIKAPNDSIIMIAVRYYSIKNDPVRKFRSYYTLGCVYNELQQYTQAAVALGQAEQLKDLVDDDFRVGLLYTQLGDVFFNSYDFHRAEQYYRLAMDYYHQASKDIHRIYALYDIGRCEIHLLRYEEAHETMNEVYLWAQHNNDSKLLTASLKRLLLCSIHNINAKDATDEIERYLDISDYQDSDVFTSLLIAKYYIMTGNKTQADYYLNKSWSNAVSIQDSILLWYNESLIDQQSGQIESSYNKYRKSIQLQNQNIYKLLDQPILGAQKDYFKALSETELLLANQRKSRLIIVSLLLIVLLFLVIMGYIIFRARSEQRKRDYLLVKEDLSAKEFLNKKKIKELNQQLDEQSLKELDANKSIELLSQKVRTLFHEQFGPTDFVLTRYYEFMSNSEKAKRLYKIVEEHLQEFTSKDNTARIDAHLNELYNQIMKDITDSSVSLSEKEVNVFRFLIAGLSAKSIATLLDCSKDSIYKTRDRALLKIEETGLRLYCKLCNVLKIK